MNGSVFCAPSDLERRNLHAVLEGCPVGVAVVAHGRLCFANAFFMENTQLAPGAKDLRIVFDSAPSGVGHDDLGGKHATLFWDAPDGGECRMRLIAHRAPYGEEDAFFLWLPRVAEDVTRPATLSSPKSRGRILLAEDNEINQEIALELLELAGVQVDVAFNGKEAVGLFLEKDFDLILMDIQMPLMDGMDATRAIRASGKPGADTVPILAMTAHGMDSDREKSLHAGMNDHLIKPIEPQLLYAALDTWLPVRSPDFVNAPSMSAASAPQEAGGRPAPEQTDVPGEASQTDILCSLKGFDSQAGLSNVVGNRELYLRLLDRFAKNYCNSSMELRDALKRMEHDASAHEEAMRLAHTAKGVAANLGAIALAAVAGELEDAIEKNKVQEEMLVRYDLLLREALDAIEALPKQDDVRVGQKAISAADKVRIATVLHALPASMEVDWYGAQQRLLALSAIVEDTAVAAYFRELTIALEEFDSAGVADIGKRLLAAI